jgi:hypothetical protein
LPGVYVRGQDAPAVELAVTQVQPEEPADIEDVADKPPVGGTVDMERVQRQVRAMPGSGHPGLLYCAAVPRT